MSRSCEVCNHNKRLEIDREIVAGKSILGIARNFGVSANSVTYHKENHLSRQLTQAWGKRNGIEAMGLLADIESIVGKARLIFDRNFEAGKDLTALKALDSERATFGLLVEIARLYHETRLAELHQVREEEDLEAQARTQEGLKRLTFEELEIFYYLRQKMTGEMEGVEVPAVFKAATSPPPVPRQPLPPPRLKTACTTAPKPDYTVEEPDPGPTPGLEPEQEPEPELPPGLPPAPVREIPGGGRGLKLRRYLLGRKIYEGLKE